MRRSLVATTLTAALAVAAPAAATGLPRAGKLVPGRSLGGIRLGESQAAVRAALGTFYGACRDCHRPTWYFTYRPFEAHGLAVEFSRARVSAVYTLWRPRGWRAPDGLAFGSSPLAVHRRGHTTRTVACHGYEALVRDSVHASSAYYLFDGSLWGFGLFGRGDNPCR
jgi:hypothetical protein